MTTRPYNLTIAANSAVVLPVVGKMYKITKATGPVTVRRSDGSVYEECDSGKGEQSLNEFNRLEITNKTASQNTITVLISDGELIDDSITIASGAAIPTYPAAALGSTLNYQSAPVNGSVVLIPPAANTAGLFIEHAEAYVEAGAGNGGSGVFIANSSDPSSVTDGQIITNIGFLQVNTSYNIAKGVRANFKLNAGLGLYTFIGVTVLVNGRANATARPI